MWYSRLKCSRTYAQCLYGIPGAQTGFDSHCAKSEAALVSCLMRSPGCRWPDEYRALCYTCLLAHFFVSLLLPLFSRALTTAPLPPHTTTFSDTFSNNNRSRTTHFVHAAMHGHISKFKSKLYYKPRQDRTTMTLGFFKTTNYISYHKSNREL